MITTTPATCQNTEMLLNSATRCEEKMLTMAWTTSSTANTIQISPSVALSAKLMKPRSRLHRLNSEDANVAAA